MGERTKIIVALGVIVVAAIAIVYFLTRSAPVAGENPLLSFVSGTEYNIGEQGQVIVEGRFANGTSALSSCDLLAWYPDKSLFFNMSASLSASGSMYVNFTIPNVTGVYEYQAQCVLVNNRTSVVGKSFHVSEFQNDTSSKLNRIKAVMPK